jgi:acetyl esterase
VPDYKNIIEPALHKLMYVPPVNYENKFLLKLIEGYARLNYFLTKPNKGIFVSEHMASDNGVKVRVDHYKNNTVSGRRPCLLYFHGGGFAMPAYGYQKKILSEYALGAGCDIFSVDYSLSPASTSSKILIETYAALLWLLSKTDEFNIDKGKIAVGGDSAGGCLAASLTQMTADKLDEGVISFQLLIYPVTDNALSTESQKMFQDAPVWSGLACVSMWKAYLDNSNENINQYAVPMNYNAFSKLPPAYIDNAEIDPLRDEGVMYANKLKAAGVAVSLYEAKRVTHGYDCLLNEEFTRTAISKRIDALKNAFSVQDKTSQTN